MTRYVPVHLRRDPKPLVPLTNFRRSPSAGPAAVAPQAQVADESSLRLTEHHDRHQAWRQDMETLAAGLAQLFGPLS